MDMKNYTVLVVDDEAEALNMVGLMLRNSPFDVITATNGEDALAKAQSSSVDIVLLDIMMPDISGVTVCGHLRATPQKGIAGWRNRPAHQACCTRGTTVQAKWRTSRASCKFSQLGQIGSVIRHTQRMPSRHTLFCTSAAARQSGKLNMLSRSNF